MSSPATLVFPTSIDLVALHAAFRDEGFTEVTLPRDVTFGRRRYTKTIGDETSNAMVPTVPSDDSDLIDYLEGVHVQARNALLLLIEVTGNQHFECGPTSLRERTLIEALNLARTGTVADTCTCGNSFAGDNLCMPSACQNEE